MRTISSRTARIPHAPRRRHACPLHQTRIRRVRRFPGIDPTVSTFAWNHGDVQEDITRTWMAMAGPGVRRLGRNDDTFSDHTDVRPTMMSLLGLRDSYVHDGRVLIEDLDEEARSQSLRGD